MILDSHSVWITWICEVVDKIWLCANLCKVSAAVSLAYAESTLSSDWLRDKSPCPTCVWCRVSKSWADAESTLCVQLVCIEIELECTSNLGIEDLQPCQVVCVCVCCVCVCVCVGGCYFVPLSQGSREKDSYFSLTSMNRCWGHSSGVCVCVCVCVCVYCELL